MKTAAPRIPNIEN